MYLQYKLKGDMHWSRGAITVFTQNDMRSSCSKPLGDYLTLNE